MKQAWVSKNSVSLKTAEIWGIEKGRSCCDPSAWSTQAVSPPDKTRIVEFGREKHLLKRDKDAHKLWAQVYPELSDGKAGFGAVTSRAEAQVLRLSGFAHPGELVELIQVVCSARHKSALRSFEKI